MIRIGYSLAKHLFNPKWRICSGINWDNLFRRESRLQHYQQQQVDERVKARQERSRFLQCMSLCKLCIICLVFILIFCTHLCFCIRGSACVCPAVIGQLKSSDQQQKPLCFQWKNKIYWMASVSVQYNNYNNFLL